MRKNYIKYFYNSYGYAKRRNLGSEYLFFLRLKTIANGELRVGSITEAVQSITSYSPASISYYIRRLTKAGFLIPYKIKGKVVGYQIISYKRAMKLIGMKIRFSGNLKNIAKEHRFQRIELGSLDDTKVFKNYIEMMDVYHNSEKQLYKKVRSLKRKIDYQEKKEQTLETKKKIEQLRSDFESVKAIDNHSFKLSCRKLSRILGYSSVQQGSLIERRAEANSFLKIKREHKVIERGVSFLEFNPMKALDDSLYWMYGNIVKNECNVLQLTDSFFSLFENNKRKHAILK